MSTTNDRGAEHAIEVGLRVESEHRDPVVIEGHRAVKPAN